MAVDVGQLLASPVEVRARVAGVVQREQHEVVAQRLPVGLAGVRPAGGVAAGEPKPLGGELLDDRVRRAGLLEALEQVRDRAAHFGVGVECHVAELVICEADGQPDAQLAAGGLGQQPALEPGADEVKLGLGDRALQAEQEPVVDLARVIETVLVADQRPRQRAQLQQPVPVGVVARQPRALQAEHDPGLAQRHVRDEALEPLAVGGRGAGLALVDIDHDHPARPASRARPPGRAGRTDGAMTRCCWRPDTGSTAARTGTRRGADDPRSPCSDRSSGLLHARDRHVGQAASASVICASTATT